MNSMLYADVIIVGGGLAALMAGFFRDGADVVCGEVDCRGGVEAV